MRDEFDRLWPLLEKAVLRYGPTHSKEHVWTMIEEGRAQFFPAPNAAIVTEILTWPTGFKEIRVWLAGGDLAEIRVMQKYIAGWAKEQGCKRAVLNGRRGWLRALNGYHERFVAMTKEL